MPPEREIGESWLDWRSLPNKRARPSAGVLAEKSGEADVVFGLEGADDFAGDVAGDVLTLGDFGEDEDAAEVRSSKFETTGKAEGAKVEWEEAAGDLARPQRFQSYHDGTTRRRGSRIPS